MIKSSGSVNALAHIAHPITAKINHIVIMLSNKDLQAMSKEQIAQAYEELQTIHLKLVQQYAKAIEDNAALSVAHAALQASQYDKTKKPPIP